MKLRNKKTGEIKELPDGFFCGDSLKKICEEWEDYKEPKAYWYIDYNGAIKCFQYLDFDWQEEMQTIGNYFETKEEAEKTLEKLKAWKRLKDKGLKFEWWISKPEGNEIDFYLDEFEWSGQVKDDLDLLFGGKE